MYHRISATVPIAWRKVWAAFFALESRILEKSLYKQRMRLWHSRRDTEALSCGQKGVSPSAVVKIPNAGD